MVVEEEAMRNLIVDPCSMFTAAKCALEMPFKYRPLAFPLPLPPSSWRRAAASRYADTRTNYPAPFPSIFPQQSGKLKRWKIV